MGMFDYKDYSREKSAELMSDSQKLATYANAAAIMYLPAADLLNGVGQIFGENLAADPIRVAPPAGWREIAPAQLGLPESALDAAGYYTIASPLTGNVINGMGPQAKIFGKFDTNGKLTQVSLTWAGTNDPLDIADYFQINSGEIAQKMNPLLEVVKNFTLANGLDAKDVLITGYSLGGGMTNIMAEHRNGLADGFFAESDYIGHAAPVIYDNADVVLNMGFENDVVYRITGNEKSIADAVAAGKPGLVNPDKMFGNTFDNIVLFGDTYASPLWDVSPFSLLNIPFGWAAHIGGVAAEAVQRIAASPFYDYMHADSTVVVDNLSALTRSFVWVEDKAAPTSDHFGTPAFIIGSARDNLLKASAAGGYVDAGAGDDIIQIGGGATRVHGGSGEDTLRLSGSLKDWDIYRLTDGTHFFHDGSRLVQTEDVENVAFNGEWLSHTRPYTLAEDGIADNRYQVFKSLNRNGSYAAHEEGSSGSDFLHGKTVFARGGDDFVLAEDSGSLLHGGEGNDVLLGGAGDDFLYGAEGSDYLNAGGGKNRLCGGVGDDIFAFSAGGSHTVTDFNAYAGDADKLLFTKDLFSSVQEVLDSTHSSGSSLVIEKGGFSLQLDNVSLHQLTASAIEIYG